MKILAPVDVHDSSFASCDYAVRLAAQMGASVTVLYVINSVFHDNQVISYDPYLELKKTANKQLAEFIENYENTYKESLPEVKINLEVIFGIPGIAIPEFAESNDFDIIVMGIRDKYGWYDRLLGSASNETIKEAECPVILIHQRTVFKRPEKALFAFDKKTDLEDALEEFKDFNSILRAKTDFLHINVDGIDDVSKQKTEIVSELFEQEPPTFAFEIKTLSGQNIIAALNEYCRSKHIDIVSMIQREEGLFSNFLQPNKSIKLAQELHLPVIVFQED